MPNLSTRPLIEIPEEERPLALSQRGKIITAIGGVIAVAVIAVVGYALATGENPVAAITDPITGGDEPPTCPLTGENAASEKAANQPVVAVKVDNTEAARPQVGIDEADLVYEELVEGGITRWIVVFQCAKPDRVGPIRSARTTDAEVLIQFGKPVLGFSGGAKSVVKYVKRSGVQAFDEDAGGEAFTRDPSRVPPQDLFLDIPKLAKQGKKAKAEVPEPQFEYSDELPEGRSKKAGQIDMVFSSINQAAWEWNKGEERWARFDGGSPNVLENGDQILANNVVVQMVKVTEGEITDASGSPSPEVKVTGKGKAMLFRDGRVFSGTWERPSLEDRTTFTTREGDAFVLTPGNTWIELFPSSDGFVESSLEVSK
ncbi:MAG: DUF3048 domain-containing protein [Actinomycetota bacterium]